MTKARLKTPDANTVEASSLPGAWWRKAHAEAEAIVEEERKILNLYLYKEKKMTPDQYEGELVEAKVEEVAKGLKGRYKAEAQLPIKIRVSRMSDLEAKGVIARYEALGWKITVENGWFSSIVHMDRGQNKCGQ